MEMKKYGKPIFAIIVAALLISVGLLSYILLGGGQEAFLGNGDDPLPGEVTPPITTNLAPDFSYPSVTGGTVSLSALRGKVVVLDFMATWCQPCREQMKNLKTVQSKYVNQPVTIISIGVDPQESTQVILDYRTDVGATWLFVIDTNGIYMDPKYSATSIPTMIIINKEGQIVKREVGITSASALINIIDPLL